MVVGLLSDPELPATIAWRLAGRLPRLLGERVDDRIEWRVVNVTQDLSTGEDLGDRMIDNADEQRRHEEWDVVICLTDLPIRTAGRPLVADVSTERRVAVVSIPSFGGILSQRRAQDLLVDLVARLVGMRPDADPRPGWDGQIGRLITPLHRVDATDDVDDVDLRLTAGRLPARLRLLLGMVRVNRPWRLALGLSKALAAALAAAVLASTNGIVWEIADSLSAWRLALATAFAVGSMVTWLIAEHRLWLRAGQDGRRDELLLLYNVATLLTLAMGVSCLCAALFVVDLAGQSFAIGTDALSRQLHHQVGPATYLRLAWLVSSVATVGGALGSGLETRWAVRSATYGSRKHARGPDLTAP